MKEFENVIPDIEGARRIGVMPPDAVATAWEEAPGRLTKAQVHLLFTAAVGAQMSVLDFSALVAQLTAKPDLYSLTQADFDRLMDHFVAAGFRDPALPIVSADQVAFLKRACRVLRIDRRTFLTAMRDLAEVDDERRLTGIGFVIITRWLIDRGAVFALLDERGAPPVPSYGHAGIFPHPRFVDRAKAAALHRVRYWCGVEAGDFELARADLSGATRTMLLDQRQYERLAAFMGTVGVPVPAPRVSGEPGFITQAQANLIWKLWHDQSGSNGDVSEAALDRSIGGFLAFQGGLKTLTRAGARRVLDFQLAEAFKARRASRTGY